MTISPATNRVRSLSLNTKDLFSISEEISAKYSPILSQKKPGNTRKIALTPKQLQEISNEISRKFSLKLNPLQPKLVLLPIDPVHLFASWNLGQTPESAVTLETNQKQDIVLRIYPKQANQIDSANHNNWLDIPIDPARSKQIIDIKPSSNTTTYLAVIGYIEKDKNSALSSIASSKEIRMPTRYSMENPKDEKVITPSSRNRNSAAVQSPLFVFQNTSSTRRD